MGEEKDRSTLRQRVSEAAIVGGWAPRPSVFVGASVGGGLGRNEISEFSVDANSVFPGPAGVPIVLDPEGVVLRERWASGMLFAEARTLDRLAVPTRGVRLRLQAEAGQGRLDASDFSDRIAEQAGVSPESLGLDRVRAGAFNRALIDAEGWLPVSPRVSFVGRAAYARGAGEGLPLNRRTFVGGIQTVTVLPGTFLPLYGHDPESLTGPNAWLASPACRSARRTRSTRACSPTPAAPSATTTRSWTHRACSRASGWTCRCGRPSARSRSRSAPTRSDRFPDVGVRVGHVF